MDKQISIFGAGELYTQVKPLLEDGGYIITNVFDDTKPEMALGNKISKYPLVYCVGYKNMKRRYERFLELKRNGNSFISFIASNVIFSRLSTIKEGSIINQGSIIDNYIEIGECVFINIGTMISHHTKIGDNVFIGPGVNLAGYVNVGEEVFIGTNATIINNINIGKGAIVAAGAVVIDDVPPYSMVAGNPAKVKKRLNSNV